MDFPPEIRTHALRYNIAVVRWQPQVQAALKKILFGDVPYHGNAGTLRDNVFIVSNFGDGSQAWQAKLRAVHVGNRSVLRGRTSTIAKDPDGRTTIAFAGDALELVDTVDGFDANPPSLRLIAQNLQTETGNTKGPGKGNNGAKAIVFAAKNLDGSHLGTLARRVDAHLDLLYHCMPLPADAITVLESFGAAFCRVAGIQGNPNCAVLAPEPILRVAARHMWYAFTQELFQLLTDPQGAALTRGDRALELRDSQRVQVRFATVDERVRALATTRGTIDAMIVLRSLRNLFGNDFFLDQAGTEQERHGFPLEAAAVDVLERSMAALLRAAAALVLAGKPGQHVDFGRTVSAVKSEVKEALRADTARVEAAQHAHRESRAPMKQAPAKNAGKKKPQSSSDKAVPVFANRFGTFARQ